MIALITGIIQLVFLILKNKFEENSTERKRKEELHKDWVDAVKSGDKSRIHSIIERLRI